MKHIKKILCFLLVIAAVAGAIYLCGGFGKDDKGTAMAGFFDTLGSELGNEELSFEKVQELYSVYEENVAAWSKEPEWGNYTTAVEQLEAYKYVVDVLTRECTTPKEVAVAVEGIKALEPADASMRRLNRIHWTNVLYLYWGDYSDIYNPRLYSEKNLDGRGVPTTEDFRVVYRNAAWGPEQFVKMWKVKPYDTFKSLEEFRLSRSFEDEINHNG